MRSGILRARDQVVIFIKFLAFSKRFVTGARKNTYEYSNALDIGRGECGGGNIASQEKKADQRKHAIGSYEHGSAATGNRVWLY